MIEAAKDVVAGFLISIAVQPRALLHETKA